MPRILVAPLNWGLGHASRCIPVIRELIAQNHEVWLATDGVALAYLRKEFPGLPTLELPSYRMTYPTSSIIYNVARNSRHVIMARAGEHKILDKWVEEHGFDGVISDSRLGLFNDRIKTVVITHQVRFPSPIRMLQFLGNIAGRKWWGKYQHIWVPDFAGDQNLAGFLAHDTGMNLDFMGSLSRMRADLPLENEPERDVMLLLSGPEPARTKFEKVLIEQAKEIPRKFYLVRGLPSTQENLAVPDNIEAVNFLTSGPLNRALIQSKVVVCRSGYSTVMDLAALGKKAFFVPTPGQPEQEYLAEYYAEKKWYYTQEQTHINLAEALKRSEEYSGLFLPPDDGRVKELIKGVFG